MSEESEQIGYTYSGFRVEDAVADIPFEGWRQLLRRIVNKFGQQIDKGIAEHMRVFGEVIPVLPPPDALFRAFKTFDVPDTRVVIIGQDCYPTFGDAMGLCFSVPRGTRVPPSLRNIFKELEREYGRRREDGDLSDWASQGVLMLNTALTVRQGAAGSHMRMWADFTEAVIESFAKNTERVCFLLWGAHAIEYERLIPADRGHLVLKHSHPSPLSRKPFEGCGHFEAANAFLTSQAAKPPVDWVNTT